MRSMTRFHYWLCNPKETIDSWHTYGLTVNSSKFVFRCIRICICHSRSNSDNPVSLHARFVKGHKTKPTSIAEMDDVNRTVASCRYEFASTVSYSVERLI